MALSFSELEKALATLEESIQLYEAAKSESPEKKAFSDASIQRFEYLIELSWKISLKHLGSKVSAAKPAIREMARNNLIQNPEDWLLFIDARNDTSHSYDEEVAKRVFDRAKRLPLEVKKLLAELKK
ncbi:MAG: HI0074 family nucleotidyltransferase substrate-binding subunit [Bdellovibrionales bacterium]|nr:HI0074 family nucleotidyltransferase substrate-binding subunit [Bdellovibrionales bacterium]